MIRREIDSWFLERRKKANVEEIKKIDESVFQGEEEVVEGEGGEEDLVSDLRVFGENGFLEIFGNYILVERKVSFIKINFKNLRVIEVNGKSEFLGLGICEFEDDGLSKLVEQFLGRVSYKKIVQQRYLLR